MAPSGFQATRVKDAGVGKRRIQSGQLSINTAATESDRVNFVTQNDCLDQRAFPSSCRPTTMANQDVVIFRGKIRTRNTAAEAPKESLDLPQRCWSCRV